MPMNRVNPALFSACFTAWVKACWPDRPDLIAIDGKTSRRSHGRASGAAPLHLVSAFAAETVRAHRAIENSLHRVFDVTFKEDQSRTRRRHGARNMAIVRHFGIDLVRQAEIFPPEHAGLRACLSRFSVPFLWPA